MGLFWLSVIITEIITIDLVINDSLGCKYNHSLAINDFEGRMGKPYVCES